jgi:hypothetical protein
LDRMPGPFKAVITCLLLLVSWKSSRRFIISLLHSTDGI